MILTKNFDFPRILMQKHPINWCIKMTILRNLTFQEFWCQMTKKKMNLTCFWAISEVFWFEPILSMPSKNITPRWALDRSKSALRYNFDITELIVSLFSSHPDINSTRLPRRSCNFRGGGRTLELFLPFDDFSVRAQRSETALRNSPGDFWVSGLQEKNVKIKNNFLAGNLKKNVAPTAKHLVFCYHNCSDLLWEKICSRDWEKLWDH